MSENVLDMLDRVHGEGRDFVAEQIVAGSSNAQVADAIAAKFGVDPPSVRSVSQWSNHDKKLLAKVAKLREDGADPERAHATVIAALEARLENPDKLSVSELLEIKKALERQTGKTAAADAFRDEESGIDHAVMDAFFFSLAVDYGEEGRHFAEVCQREDATIEEVVAAFPKGADVVLAEAEEAFGGS